MFCHKHARIINIIVKNTKKRRQDINSCRLFYTSPQRLQTFKVFSPSDFSQRSLTPVRVQAGQLPRQPFRARASFPRLGFGIKISLTNEILQALYGFFALLVKREYMR
jgi:hypothetical protein